VHLLKDSLINHERVNQDFIKDVNSNNLIELIPEYREAPYTPIKKIVDTEIENKNKLESLIELAVKNSIDKKEQIKNWMETNQRE
jgi:hydrogenase expression/formation protein